MPQYGTETVPKNDVAQKYQRKHDMTGTFILVKPNPILLRLNTKPVTLPVYTVYVTVTWQYIWHNIWCYHNAENIEYILSFRETTSYIITAGFLQYSHSMISSFYQYWIMLEFNMIYKKPIRLYYMTPTNLDRNDLVTKKSLYCKIGTLYWQFIRYSSEQKVMKSLYILCFNKDTRHFQRHLYQEKWPRCHEGVVIGVGDLKYAEIDPKLTWRGNKIFI